MFESQITWCRQRLAAGRLKWQAFCRQQQQYARQFAQKAGRTYRRYEKYIPVTAFVAGFLYDSLTLTRIDAWLDNLILLLYTLFAGVLLVVLGRMQRGHRFPLWLEQRHDWLTFGLHFLFGSLLSSYVVFYFKSAAVFTSYLFIGLLVALLLLNEFFFHRLRHLRLLVAIYFFCCFAFLTFFLPVVTRVMNSLMFLASGVLSLVLIAGLWFAIYGKALAGMKNDLHRLLWPPLAIFAAQVLFYFLNWMPPVPLALKEGGIYRSVRRVADRYEVKYTTPRWWQVFKKDDRDFAYTPGDTIYCFAAVFAPTALKQRIVHHWQKKNAAGDWVTRDAISYEAHGGRDGGWRWYTRKRNAEPGSWRVEVRTQNGRLLGRIPFEVYEAKERPTRFTTDYL
ncbi:MAG: DUF2914 domain-containing protein [candidate division KSB1 bacterium]|nr:DUF2914 domain-containing protein [candidate division KSB1 bacterium]MDZ7274560.1 DUF2914 domain-containing protein [candidate division KSB1 bacterium]MDZ7284779.1 DUF2914 domain-containing protein [candidate division KSB1 bacterium]MDZ7297801.1 DUF2914 domain-containing protein [candidate division KSB1 bacterium]MDZ7306410.1 DUF2914 domain-containing protein [candidate division KSB1 bacterium]